MILVYAYIVVSVIFTSSILLKKPLTGSPKDYRYLVDHSSNAVYPTLYRVIVALMGGLFWWVTLYFRFQDLLHAERSVYGDD